MTFIRKLPTLKPEMRGALRNHIIRKRQRLKQELEQEAIEKRLRREKELKRVQDAMTLDQIKEQLSALEKKLETLRDEKHHLFVQLKQLLSEENTRRKQVEDTQQPTSVEQQKPYQQKQSNNVITQLPGIAIPNVRSSIPTINEIPTSINHRPRVSSLACSDANTVLRQQQQQAINHITSQHQQMFPHQLIKHPSMTEPQQPRTSSYHFNQSNIPSPLAISTSYPDLSNYLRAQQGNPIATNALSSQAHLGGLDNPAPPPPFLPTNHLEFALQHRLPIPTALTHQSIPHIDTPISLTTSTSSNSFDPSQILSGKRSYSDVNSNGESSDGRGLSRKKHNNFQYPPTSRFQIEALATSIPNLAHLGFLDNLPPTSNLSSIRHPHPALIDHQFLPPTLSTPSSNMMNIPRSLHSSNLSLNYDYSPVSQANAPKPRVILPGLNSYHPDNTPLPHPHQHHLLPPPHLLPHNMYPPSGIDMKNYPFHNINPQFASRFGLPPLHDQSPRYLPTPNVPNHLHKKLHKPNK